MLFLGTLANAQCPSGCLFYGGDFDANNPNANGLSNEKDLIVGGNPYGAATYQNFINSQTWNVTGLFTNNLSTLTPSSGYWEIRSGMSEGNGGTLIASGTGSGGNFSQTPTGRGGFGYTEYTDLVSGLNVNLPSGMYWLAMVPNMPDLRWPFVQQQQSGRTERRRHPDQRPAVLERLVLQITNADNFGVASRPSPAAFWEPRCLSRPA